MYIVGMDVTQRKVAIKIFNKDKFKDQHDLQQVYIYHVYIYFYVYDYLFLLQHLCFLSSRI